MARCWERWRQEKKGTTEDEMVGWHHWLNGHEFWASSGSWWWTGRPGVLQSMGLQRVRHNWAIEPNWTDGKIKYLKIILRNVWDPYEELDWVWGKSWINGETDRVRDGSLDAVEMWSFPRLLLGLRKSQSNISRRFWENLTKSHPSSTEKNKPVRRAKIIMKKKWMLLLRDPQIKA